MTSKVYFVFIYKWQLFYYQIQKVIKILRRLLKFLMLCNAWLTLVNHLHFKYTHIHIYPYCVYVWVFPLYWKVMTDANASIVCLLLIRNKIFIKISYEICCFACTYLGPPSLADLHQHLPIENVFNASTSFGPAKFLRFNDNICCFMDGSWWKMSKVFPSPTLVR